MTASDTTDIVDLPEGLRPPHEEFPPVFTLTHQFDYPHYATVRSRARSMESRQVRHLLRTDVLEEGQVLALDDAQPGAVAVVRRDGLVELPGLEHEPMTLTVAARFLDGSATGLGSRKWVAGTNEEGENITIHDLHDAAADLDDPHAVEYTPVVASVISSAAA